MLPQQAGPSRDGRDSDIVEAACIMGPVEPLELAFIGLGANVGAPRIALERSVSALSELPGAVLAGVSRLYRTRPVGPVEQGHFLNAVVGLRVPSPSEPAHDAMALLVELKALERSIGRIERERWGPREIDLDLLLYGSHDLLLERDAAARSVDPAKGDAQWLRVPHPSAASRLFVLAPLAELAPSLVPPGWGMSVSSARVRAEEAEGQDAVEAVADWDRRSGRWRDRSA